MFVAYNVIYNEYIHFNALPIAFETEIETEKMIRYIVNVSAVHNVLASIEEYIVIQINYEPYRYILATEIAGIFRPASVTLQMEKIHER